MSDNPAGGPGKKQSNPGKIALFGAVATGLAIINIATNGSEAPRQAVAILQYAFLAMGLVGLVGGLLMMGTKK